MNPINCRTRRSPNRNKGREQQQSERATQAKYCATPTVVKPVADRAYGRPRADNRRAERAENEKETHVATAGKEFLALALSSAAEEPYTDDKCHPHDKSAQKKRYVLRVKHFSPPLRSQAGPYRRN